MGPSGAGKDSLLRYARTRLAAAPIIFAHRYATRPREAGEDNEVPLLDAEFDRRRAAGLFAFDWPAHGIRYALGAETEAWRAQGLVVVVSGSRAHYAAAGHAIPGVVPVMVTAVQAAIAARLAARGREDDGAIAARLVRGGEFTIDEPRLLTLDNSGAIAEAGDRLVALLTRLTAEAAAGS